MPQKSLISICDQQVSLPLLYFNSVCEFRGPTAGGIHQDLRPDFRTVGQPDSAVSDLRNRTTDKLRPALLRPLNEKSTRRRGVQNPVLGNQQPTGHAVTQVRLKLLQCFRVENFCRNAPGGIILLLAPYLCHLLIIGSKPDGSALLV